ncbi:hypothetical protein DF046_19510 [Burkholderia cepacia]|nr:hypothetical protein DF046_19510 [Burkholderia cepacia]
MANGWTPERRAKQAEAIRRWKPWERSTGPATFEGKAVSAQNARKHGLRSSEWKEERRLVVAFLRECRQRLKFTGDG